MDDFRDAFGPVTREEIIGRLKARDEDVFAVVSNIFSRRMGMPIRAVGQESLHDIIKGHQGQLLRSRVNHTQVC